MSNYLLEIGTEELPYKFIPSAISQLKDGFKKFLDENKIEYKDIEVMATPRRLAVFVYDLASAQPDTKKVVKGPIKKIAYDENGNLSKAGLGFLNKNGLKEEDTYLQDDYLYASVFIKGKTTAEVLQENVEGIVLKIQGSHFMRWSSHEVKFSRPIRRVVSLLDDKELPIKIIDEESSRNTIGHRFSKNKEVSVKSADTYIEQMREANVIVNQNERMELIKTLTKQKAKEIGAEPVYTDDLLEEVTYLCEYPVPVLCDFDEKYLAIPEEVTVTVMAKHQRYFALYKNGKLLNKFITIANYVGDEFKNIKAGNERVIVARLEDAVFFFNEDTKKKLEDYVENLKGMTFQKGLGTVLDKTERIVKLSNYISEKLNCKKDTIERTAYLCKADLTTSLVFEFTELQGYIGADYARISNEKPEVCEGIKEHYFPLSAQSETAKTIEGQIVGIADKIDTICAVFIGGKVPTGSSDPLGVRRAALGIIRTILNNKLNLNISNLIRKCLEVLGKGEDQEEQIKTFITQRLIIFLSESMRKDVLNSCSSNKDPLENICDYVQRVNALSESLSNKNLAPVLESANRIIRLVKEDCGSVDETMLNLEEEKALYKAINSVDETLEYKELINKFIEINPVIVNFFDKVLVMDKDEKVKNNRLALLSILKRKYEIIADFSHVQN